MVNITKKSFSCPTNSDEEVVDIDSNSDEDCVSVCAAQDDDSCFIVESRPGHLEFQAVNDNVVILDPIKEEPDIEPEQDPLSTETFIKPEPSEIKVEKSYDVTPASCGGKQLKEHNLKGIGVAVFRCDLCSYTSQHRHVIGHHKWRAHNVKGKKKLLVESNRPSNSSKIRPIIANKFGRIFRCNFCPFTTKFKTALGPHKYFMHNLKEKKKIKVTSHTQVTKYNIRRLSSTENNIKGEVNVNKDNEIKETQKPQDFKESTEVPIMKKCSYCCFETKFNHALAMHKKIKHIKGVMNVSKDNEIKETQKPQDLNERIEVPIMKKCSHCCFETKFNHALVMHKKIKHLIEPDRSDRAGKVISNHLIKKCSHCPFKTKFNAALAMHKKTQHFIQPERRAVKNIRIPLIKKCPHCPFKTKFNHALVMHKKTKHSADQDKNANVIENKDTLVKRKCSYCSFEAKSNKSMIIHNRRKHMIQPKRIVEPDAGGRYQCQQCQNSYSHYHNLVRHIKNEHHVEKTKRKCPYCGKSMVFEFQLRRHIEKNHPIQWKNLKKEKQNKTQNHREEEFSTEKETVKKLVEGNKANVSIEPSKVKFNCQFCSFRTEDFHILGLHKQIHHTKRIEEGQDRVLECLFCPEICSFGFEMKRHTMTRHPGAWLKMERNAKQSDSHQSEVTGRELRKESNITTPSNTRMKSTDQNETIQITSMTDNLLSESKNSLFSLKDMEGGEQAEAKKKFCGKCERFYNHQYYNYHTCKKKLKCDLCNYKSTSKYWMQMHKKVHSNQENIEIGNNSENKNHLDHNKKGFEGISRVEENSQEHIQNETASIGCSSNSEMNEDEEYIPSSTQRRVYKFNGPRKTCKTCKKTYHSTYFRYHRCTELLKCSCCSYTGTSLKKLKFHQRIHHPYLENENVSTASIEGKKSNDEIKPTYSGSKEEINVGNVVNHEMIHENDENKGSPNATLGEGMVFCEQCNSHHKSKYLWKYVCYRQNKIYCNMCSFFSSSKGIMARHKTKQHSKKKLPAGNGQSCRSLKCDFCPLLFSNVHQLKNHLSMKHNDQQNAKIKSIRAGQFVKPSQHSKPTNKADNFFIEKESNNSHSDIHEASSSSVYKKSVVKQKGKKTCPLCRKSYNRVYYRYHRCSEVKLHQRKDDEQASNIISLEKQSVTDAAMEESEQLPSDVAKEIESTTDPAFGNTQRPSKINIEENQLSLEIPIEESQPLTTNASEETIPPSNNTEGSPEVLGGKIKCENCKMYFKTLIFQGHYCRPILRCQKCPFKTRIKIHMMQHDKKHLMEDSVLIEGSLYQCKTCKKKFASQSSFVHHKINECKKKPIHQCSYCQKKFYQKKNLDLHFLHNHNEKNNEVENDEKKENENSEPSCPLIMTGVTNTQ